MPGWLILYLVCAVAALLASAALTLQTAEFLRYARSCCRRANRPLDRRVEVFAPCKGVDPQLDDNLRPLFQQSYPNYELTFIVESRDDPAVPTLERLMREHPRTAARILVAGLAQCGGQKVHNLLEATANLDRRVEILAFVDSDARPARDWLLTLVQQLGRHGVAAATAYRWMIPRRSTLAHDLLYSVNSAVASLVGPGKQAMIWGGAWAIERAAFERCALRAAWQGTLSDDLVAARTLARANLKIHFQPACMVASPIDFDWAGVAEFARRQYTIGRVYAPRWYWASLLTVALMQGALWGGAVLAGLGAARGAAWWSTPAAAAGGLYLLGLARGWMRQRSVHHFLADRYSALRWPRRFDVWFSPLAGLANLLAMLAALAGRRIVWRGIAYAMQPDGQVQILSRPQSTASTAPGAAASRQAA